MHTLEEIFKRFIHRGNFKIITNTTINRLTQLTIDRAKGIIAKPMPEYWYNERDNVVSEDDDDEAIRRKEFNQKITASNKPYFMTYVYQDLRTKNNTYNKNVESGAVLRFHSKGIRSMEDLYNYEPKDQAMLDALRLHRDVVGSNPCVVNRICWLFEDIFNGYLTKRHDHPEFDYTILKCGVDYSRNNFRDVLAVYNDYKRRMDAFHSKSRTDKVDSYESWQQRETMINNFRRECDIICPNERELCDIVLDICYESDSAKQFAWDVCGDVMLRNLLEQNDWVIHFPKMVSEGGEFEYCGEKFEMCEKFVGDEYGNYFE